MPHKLMPLGKLFWVNIFVFGLTAIGTVFLSYAQENTTLQLFRSFLILVLTLPLAGLNLTAIIEKLSRRSFDWLEKLNIAAISALIVIPFLLAFEYSKFHILFPTLPIINALVIFLLAVWINPMAFEQTFDTGFLKDHLSRSTSFAFLLYAVILLIITLSYYPLPDLDPYYWLSKYRADFAQTKLTDLGAYRPLFAALAYIFNQTAQVDLYAFFKYALPFFTLLVLLPAALIARLFRTYTEQLAILLLPLASASFILYLQIPIPQAVLNLSLIFFVFFLLCSWLTRKTEFYFLAGGIAFGAYFYHEVSALILLPWLIVTLYQYHQTLLQKIKENQFSAILILFILLSYATLIITPISRFLFAWFGKGIELIGTLHTNFAFPAAYINIDGNAVGWGDWVGVVQYYAFYVGPAVLFTSLLLAWHLKSSHFSLHALKARLRANKEWLVLGISFLLFFLIAEILPRFLDIALLPERAWGFAGLFFLALIPLFFRSHPSQTRWIAPFMIAALIINAAGAIYINALKKYLITPEQLVSAQWISDTLPSNRVIFTVGNDSLLRIHAQSKIVSIKDPGFYTDIRIFDAHLKTFTDTHQNLQQRYAESLKKISDRLKNLRKENIETADTQSLIAGLQQISQTSATLQETLAGLDKRSEKVANPPIYIYYAKVSDRNPYTNRPYMDGQTTKQGGKFVFDDYPERFQRVYALPDDSIIVWKLTD